ncbi:hypothetical protein ILUMI_03818 [Ignelater luminosus]|uniref:CRAL-TRIO domain-containing protein n=1 Tax=Ignelater luminosus TaxID=2038154 RepID=A0A8K0DF33_IGNLU|nr:hypothetical protein ILUMI_03818 [Ignelater luminosus]
MHIHSDFESFYKYLPKSVLPKDYGGEEDTIQELHGKTIQDSLITNSAILYAYSNNDTDASRQFRFLCRYSLEPQGIYDLEEAGLMTVHKPSKVIADKNNEKGTLNGKVGPLSCSLKA